MNNNYTPDSGDNREFTSRQEARMSNNTGALPTVSPVHSYPGSFDFESLILSLHELFALDRQIAGQPDAGRCGVCYLHFTLSELHYREEEGFYVCRGCERMLGKQELHMLRRQQK